MVRHDPRTGMPASHEFPDNTGRLDGVPGMEEWEPHTHTIDVKNLKITFHDGIHSHFTFKIRPRSNGKSLKLEMTNDEDERFIYYDWEDNNTLYFSDKVYLDFSSSSNIDEMEEVFQSHKWDKLNTPSNSDSDSSGGASIGGKKIKKKKTKKQKVTKNKKTRKRNVRCK